MTTTFFLLCFILAAELIFAQSVSEVLKGQQQKIFQNFKLKYAKKYNDASQELYRNLIVFKNANFIADHNLKNVKPYTLGMNIFSDLTEEEFILKYTTLMVPNEKVKNAAKQESKKIELTQNICECDLDKVSKITEIEKSLGPVKNDLIVNAINKKIKKQLKLSQINKTINQFPSKISNLSPLDYNVTVTKMKQDAAKNGQNIVIPPPPTAPITVLPSSSRNLKKNDPVTSTPTLPSSLSGAVSSPQPLNQKLSNINSNNYLTGVLGSTGISPLSTSNSGTISTSQINGTIPNTSQLVASAEQNTIILAYLALLGDPDLTQVNTTTNGTANGSVLGSTTVGALITNTTNTSSTTSTTKTTTTNTLTANATTDPLVDWSNYTGPVRFQGVCGSCYTLAAIGNFQALLAIYSFGFTIQLSAQQILDCSNNTFTFGCDGGYLEGSYLFLKSNGVTTEYVYPYKSASTGTVGTCKTLSGPFKIASFRNLPQNDCAALKTELIKKPVSLGVASSRMQFYQSGVFNDCTNQVDHAVLLVGFNATKGWKIKNSWGSSWGESGYAWLQDGNTCGICSIPTAPTIASEPS